MAVSDDKQNRLSTLSQDVIAVPKKPAAPARPPEAPRSPERPAERTSERSAIDRRAIPPSQDVFRVAQPAGQDVFTSPPPVQPPPQQAYTPPPAYSPPPPPAYAQPPPPVAQRQPARARAPVADAPAMSPMVMVTGAVAVMALLVAIYGATRSNDTGGVDVAVVGKLTQELQAANERVAKLELALSAASSDAQAMNSPNQGNVLQISAGMRELRNDVDGVANDVAKLTAELGEIRSLAGAANGQAKVTTSQVEQLASRMATINEQVANLPRGGGGGGSAAAPASAETQAQIKALTARTEKMAADIRQLYRLVGGQ